MPTLRLEKFLIESFRRPHSSPTYVERRRLPQEMLAGLNIYDTSGMTRVTQQGHPMGPQPRCAHDNALQHVGSGVKNCIYNTVATTACINHPQCNRLFSAIHVSDINTNLARINNKY